MPGYTSTDATSASYADNAQSFAKPNSDWTITNGPGGCDYLNRIPKDFIDGTSKTVLFAEKIGACLGNGNKGTVWARNFNHGGYLVPHFAQQGSPYAGNSITIQSPVTNYQTCDGWYASTFHSAINTVFADGSVKAVAGTVSGSVWWASLTRNGNDGPTVE